MSLNRQHRRYRVADLHGTLQFSHPATVIDLSRSGIAIESAERLVPSRVYPLQLEGRDGLLITTSARVAWCRLFGTTVDAQGELAPLYRAGLEFQSELPEPATRLFDQLDRGAVSRIETSLRAQYKAGDSGSTLVLRDQATFEVKTLSRNGMAAEMRHAPRAGSMLEFVLPLEQPLELRGRVVDVLPAAEDPIAYLVGIEFVGVAASSQSLIDRYLQGLLRPADPTDS
jgi:hypothetical protein